MDKKYCDDYGGCPHLELTEEEQERIYKETGEHRGHWCNRYNSILKHNRQHPKIPALACCNFERDKKDDL